MTDTLKPEDLEGLPAGLLSELKGRDHAALDLIEAIVEHAPDPESFNIDRALIAWFRRTQEVVERNSMQTRLARMAKRGLIYSRGSGIYSLRDEDIPPKLTERADDGQQTED